MEDENLDLNEDFEAMLNETFHDGFKYYNVGEKVTGTIVSLGDDALLVDIGQRSEASISLADFTPEELAGMKIGDSVEATVVRFGGGVTVLSRSVGGRGADMSTVNMAREANLPIEAKVTGSNKGGFTATIGNIRAFIPISQIELGQAGPAENYVGRVFQFKVIEVREHEAVLSRAALLREEQAVEREHILAELKPGKMIPAHVVKVEKFGVFVDVGGGIHALVPVSELGWHGRDEILAGMEIGRELTVEITRVEEKDGRPRISATLRNPDDDPWIGAATALKEGMTVHGRVTRLMNFGAFVEILPGVEGLVHVSEIAIAKRIRHPGDVLSIGDSVEASILKIDQASRRIGLSIKALQTAPEKAAPTVDPDAVMEKELVKRYTAAPGQRDREPAGETAFSIALRKAGKR